MSFKTSVRFFRQLFLLLTFTLAVQVSYGQIQPPLNRMDYHLSWDGVSTILKMDIIYNSRGNDSTVFIYGNPEAGGLQNIFDILGNVKAGNGENIEIIGKERKIVVHHSITGVKTLHAEIDGKLIVSPLFLADEAFRPTLAPGFLYTRGYNLFMKVADQNYNQIGIVWDKWPPNIPYTVSTDPEAKPDEMQIISAEASIRNMFMLLMDKDMEITKSFVGKIPHFLITSKSDSTSKLPQMIKGFAGKYIPAIREYWQDYDAPFYILSAIPLRNNVESDMTGMGMSNGFSVRYRGPLDLEKTHVVAHEVSHNWIGVRLIFESVGMENNWFHEGFNDYVSICNLVKSGLYKKEDLLQYINKENLTPHYTSPVRNMPGDSIERHFFNNWLYQKLPYQRGFIYAFYLDNQIRVASNGKKTLKNFLRALFLQNKKDGSWPLTVVEFAKAIAPYLPGKDVGAEVKRYMLDGELIDFHKVKLIKAFKISYKDQIPILELTKGIDIKQVYK